MCFEIKSFDLFSKNAKYSNDFTLLSPSAAIGSLVRWAKYALLYPNSPFSLIRPICSPQPPFVLPPYPPRQNKQPHLWLGHTR